VALNYPPFVVLTSHFRVSGNPNPPAQTLQAEDQQLFTAFNALAAQAVTQAQLSPEFLPLVVLLASMSPGSAPQRVQLATLFVRNALFVLNRAAPPVASVAESARGMAPSNRAAGKRRAEGGWRRPAKKAAPSKKAGTGKKTGAVKSARSPARRAARKSKGRGR
jgi:hypothetical protein